MKHIFEHHGKRLAYQDVGQGPVLLFGHSYLWDSAMWAPQVEVLSRHYRCIVPDLWAHGDSDDAPEQTHSLADIAADMLALLDHLNIEQVTLIGLSVGGMWGVEFAQLAPSRLKALVLMDTFVGREPEVTHQKYMGMLTTIEQVQHVPAPLLDAIVPLFFAPATLAQQPHFVDAFHHSLQQLEGDRANAVARIGHLTFDRRDQIDALAKLALPVLIMVGQHDVARPPLESYLMQDEITGAELTLIPEAGHIANLEQPERVTERLTYFLQHVYRD
ncbi:2-succinyl-6-hydroxy-2,4-cyclohexadiene-1-carboxylate synthase [Salinivibrio sp. PR5]|uniref:alpha/beta fold hydrolase n=1 Tax=Salinivibrio sp. PR5 TaxID=1909484 RepID=UPI00098BBB1E|nr:alpha/beta fold hydrolase [Salinivibrio sp. PR5]OOF08120.1 2-succinyl-6-hydroxy-2,4-cyclohexadiene-1-carboxylate synthase [Salinivibrio sp. PR5]